MIIVYIIEYMNILLIDHYAGSPELGMEFRPYYMAKEWIKQGHQVLIIGATFSHLRKKQPKKGFQIIDGVTYYWIKTNQYSNNSVGRVYSMFLFIFKLRFLLWRMYKQFEPNIVIASSTYPLDIYPARKIALKYKAKLIYEVHDLWPLSPMELGGYVKWHPFIVVMQIAENYAYKYCDRVISLLPNALEHMVEHGLVKDKFNYISNGYNELEWRNKKKLSILYESFFGDLKKKGKKILGYTGGHAKSNALDYLLDAMKLIEKNDIVCILVGNGQEKERLMLRVESENIQNVIFLDPVSKLEVPSLLSCMDVLYIGWENNPLYRFGISPNKLIDYMLSAKPILHSVNAANDWVAETKCGISVMAESPQEIAKGIDYLFSLDDSILYEMGQRGYLYASENLNYSFLAEKCLSIF